MVFTNTTVHAVLVCNTVLNLRIEGFMVYLFSCERLCPGRLMIPATMWTFVFHFLVTVVALNNVVVANELLPAAGKQPHIVMIFVDDWGWANVGYHRQVPTREVQTPNFDWLCKQGIELDQHYAFRVCSPSRSSLISGRLPLHVNIQNIQPNVYNPNDTVSGFQGIPRFMTGIGAKMKAAGYATHQVGKWDAGMATPDHTPAGRGFDTSFCYYHHDNDYYTELAGSCNYNHHQVNLTDLWTTDGPGAGYNGTLYEETLFSKQVLKVQHHSMKSGRVTQVRVGQVAQP